MSFFEEPKEQSAISIRNLRESSFLRLPAELRNKIHSYVNKAECWRATVQGPRMHPGMFARANTSQPRNLALVCHQLRAETTYLPYTFKSSLYGGIFYSDQSRVRVIRLRMKLKIHSQLLKQAVLGRPGFSYYNITTARVIKELVPGNEYGELLKSKMIDFAVTLGPPLIPMAHVISRLAASPHKLQRTCNPSDYSPLCFEPVVLSIETKSPIGGGENGEVQLSVWAMARFNRLRQLIQDPVAMTLPLLLITDARWKLYLASDLAHEIHLIDAVDIGTTADIIGCFTILEALRVIFKWVEDTFAPWFSDGLRPE